MVVPYGELKDSNTQRLEHVTVGTVSAKRVLLSGYDGTNINDAYINGDGAVLIKQSVIADTNNSSTTNLDTPTYTFTGLKTTTLGVAGIQVSLYADKNCKIQVQQSPDGTNWDLIDTYYYTATGNFGITTQAISSYVRVVVNTNNETTTKFRLQTALCPIVEAVPRSLDGNGNFKVATGVDNYGFKSENTPMGELRTVEPTRLVGTSFEGTTIDANNWTTAAAGTAATIAQANAQILLTSGTSNAAAVTAFTVRRARYVGGAGMRYRAVVQVSAGLANNKRRWGIGYGASMPTVTDGAWFQFNGTEFAIVTCKGTSETKVTSFNGNLGATYDPGIGVKTYEIYWTNSKVWFVVGDEILHTVSASTATWAATMAFHVFMNSLNADVVTQSTLAVRTATIYRLGKLQTQPMSYYYASGQTAGTQLKIGSGNLHSIIFGGAANNAVVTLVDNTTGSTPVLWVYTATGALAAPVSIDFKGMPFFTGLRFVVATGNASFTIVYE
jgi:hypothetical protein